MLFIWLFSIVYDPYCCTFVTYYCWSFYMLSLCLMYYCNFCYVFLAWLWAFYINRNKFISFHHATSNFKFIKILGDCFNHDCVLFWPMFDELFYVCIIMVYCVCFILFIYYFDFHQHCISLHIMLLMGFVYFGLIPTIILTPGLCVLAAL